MDLHHIKQALEKLMVLDIRTVVGECSTDPLTGRLIPSAEAKVLVSQINLLDGDITTAFTDEFLTPPFDQIREFHSARERQGHDIIQGNIKALQEMVKLLADLSAQEKTEAPQLPPPYPS